MLDFETVVFFTMSLLLAAAAVFALMVRLYPDLPGIRHWLAGCLLLSVGYGLRLFDTLPGNWLPYWWAGLLFVSGNLAIWLGILRFCRITHRLATRWIIAAILLPWVAVVGLPHVQQLAVNLTLSGLTCLFAAQALLRAPALDVRLLRLSVAGVYLASGAVLVVRGVTMGLDALHILTLNPERLSVLGSPLSTPLSILRCFALLVLLHADRERLLRGLAMTDILTGLLNRQGFFEHASRHLARRAHEDADCVLMLDLDKFKQINDRHGHAAGDAVLRCFADVLRGQLRPHDCCGRIGGEEFAALLVGVTLAEAEAIAERVRHTWSQAPVRFADQHLPCTTSIGVADGKGSLEARLQQADAALYKAKAEGRNRVVSSAG